ncbi:hypothetical protein E8E11_002861 [Didymella keratinophila]|nr:hypothetical protein E8E11_002861 [Didymella keratinophila]
MSEPPLPQLQLPTPSVPVTPMQSLSQPDATIKELRRRMGDDVGLLSYLPDEKVRAAPFDNKVESGGHPLPVRILFGKLEQDKTPPKNVWAWLHYEPGSSRPPECRLKAFSWTGQFEEPITLEEAMEKASPMPAFTWLKPQHGRFDRGHFSLVLRYYFILQKLKLPTQWPISDIFVAESKPACKVAKTNAEESLLLQKSQMAIGTAAAQSSGVSTRLQASALPAVCLNLTYTQALQAD